MTRGRQATTTAMEPSEPRGEPFGRTWDSMPSREKFRFHILSNTRLLLLYLGVFKQGADCENPTSACRAGQSLVAPRFGGDFTLPPNIRLRAFLVHFSETFFAAAMREEADGNRKK